jgi:hypothetical protein
MIELSGDRQDRRIRLAQRLVRRFKWLPIRISLWDGYRFRCKIVRQGK